MADYDDSQYSPAPQRQEDSQGRHDQQQQQQNPQRSQEGNSISDLEDQLAALKLALEGERKRRNAEKDQAATRERVLSSRLREAEAASPKRKTGGPMVPRVAALARPRPVTPLKGERPVTPTTPRTSDSLFVTTPNSSSAPRVRGSTPKRWGTSGSRLGTAGQEITPSGIPSERGSPRRDLSPRQQTTTALQVAWNKFCIKARREFTPTELSLVSKDTLDHLMVHYGIVDAIEKAQVEGQWALLQEGKTTVGVGATPKIIYKKNRTPLRYPDHPNEFSLNGAPPKKSLSARTPLRNESPRSGNPNNTTSASGAVRTHSAHRLLTPRRAGGGNPNDTQTQSPHWKSSSAIAPAPQERKSPARGMVYLKGPGNGDFTPRGIRSEQGSTRMGGDAMKAIGLRTNNALNLTDSSNRRGIRTGFAGDHSPVQTHRPSKVVSSPNHFERSHLTTRTLANAMSSGNVYRTSQTESFQRRTPFALDPAPVSANARSQR